MIIIKPLSVIPMAIGSWMGRHNICLEQFAVAEVLGEQRLAGEAGIPKICLY